jgi:hypothetical protein
MICPLCARTDHKLYKYKDAFLIACPDAPEGKPISLDDIEKLLTEQTKELDNKLWAEYFDLGKIFQVDKSQKE